MDNLYVIAGLILLTIIYKIITWNKRNKTGSLNIDGMLIWIDNGQQTKPFFNQKYKIMGKPDLLYKMNKGGVLAVEYKHRFKNIYKSDIVQAQCAALAARGDNYPVDEILIKTKNTEKYIKLPTSDDELYGIIQEYVLSTRKANHGKNLSAIPNNYKCKSCAYRNSCTYHFTY